jgi:hypothetical protein
LLDSRGCSAATQVYFTRHSLAARSCLRRLK